ncbi:MAG: hypothetical protein GY696_15065 [Gammaproteobacteria bacterium]|nr:hypothetical protein [Gammaproteobacteria bacterium]
MVDIISSAETSAVTSGIGGGGGEPLTPGIPLEDGIDLSEGTFSGDGSLLVSIEFLNWRSFVSYESSGGLLTLDVVVFWGNLPFLNRVTPKPIRGDFRPVSPKVSPFSGFFSSKQLKRLYSFGCDFGS